MNRVTAARFIAQQVHTLGWNLRNPLVIEAMENTLEASEILTKAEIKRMLDDYVWVYGNKLYC